MKTDSLAYQGFRFTNTHLTSDTYTPSHYFLLTGEYAGRRKISAAFQYQSIVKKLTLLH